MLLILFLSLLAQAASTLDYAEFKAKIQPLLTEKRPGHARCITCHSTGTNFRLTRLPKGRAEYTEDRLHLNGPGYAAWVDVLRPRVDALLAGRPS